MAICNLFKKLSKDTGNFLMFSQYTDDLTRWLVRHNDAKVIPSRFVVMNIDYSKLEDIDLGLKTDPNEKFPNLLQNYYENACAFIKSVDIDNFEWTPEVSRNIFWNVLKDNLLDFEKWNTEATEIVEESNAKDNISEDLYYSPQIVYRDIINLQSYTEEDNIGYNELYCYIPNDAKQTKYCLRLSDEKQTLTYDKSYIEGYSEDDEGFEGLLNIAIPANTEYQYNEGLSFYDVNGNDLESSSTSLDGSDDSDNENKKFNFNTIVVLYDIWTKDSSNNEYVVYKDIPLGLYITGTIDEQGKVSNEVTKFVSNSDIYGAGTSYGLRIATRFVATPNATYIKEIAVDSNANYADFCKAMSSFSESQERMNEVLSSVTENNLEVKNHLSSFKNYRTNIPYIVNVNGKRYWFVNGKNTNATASGEIGPQGVTGERGPQGEAGVGSQGVTGAQGVTGLQGVTGAQGVTGLQGVTGAQGVTGLQGERGSNGLRGFTGPQGVTGLQGITGLQGVTGQRGGIVEYVAGKNIIIDYDSSDDQYIISATDIETGHIYNSELDSIAEGVKDYIEDASYTGSIILNQANGVRSHAEGNGTIAEGIASHAEGYWTEVSGDYSHAEGKFNKIYSKVAHAEGAYHEVSGEYAHAEGEARPSFVFFTATAEIRMLTESEKSAINGIIRQETSATKKEDVNYVIFVDNPESWSHRSFAIFESNKFIYVCPRKDLYYTTSDVESIDHSRALYCKISTDLFNGNTTEVTITEVQSAVGRASHAEGAFTEASGDYSHAEGDSTIASGNGTHVEGYCTEASGEYAHAEGYCTEASGDYSHAEGDSTIASGDNTHAEGYCTEASGDYSHAEGYNTEASGGYSHAEGYNTVASGTESHAEGLYTVAAGSHSHAEGEGLQTNEISTFTCSVIGTAERNTIKNQTGITFTYCDRNADIDSDWGFQGYIYSDPSCTQLVAKIILCRHYHISNYSGNYFNINSGSLVDGETYYWKRVCGAYGPNTHAEGRHTVASGNYAHAEGVTTAASGYSSHAEGSYTLASRDNTHAEGNNTVASGTESHAEGYNTVASGPESHAEGYNTVASGPESHAEGSYTYATGEGSHAEGSYTYATGEGSHAEGFHTEASGDYSHAEGAYNMFHEDTLSVIGNGYVREVQGAYVIVRRNAVEVMKNGFVYVDGIGNYDGTNDPADANVKSLQDVITYKQDTPKTYTISNSVSTQRLLPNNLYIFANRTNSLTIILDTTTIDSVNEYHFFIECGATAPTIVFPTGITWYGNNAPSIVANKTYEISILNNIAIYLEV